MNRIPRMAVLLIGALVLVAGDARAQMTMGPFSGAVTGHLGGVGGGDVSSGSFTLGASMSVVDDTGLGAEIDFGYTNGGDADRREANLQTYMLNFIGIYPKWKVQPVFVAGLGGMRVHGCNVSCTQALTWTDWALNVGGGVQYRVNHVVGFRGDVRYFSSLQDHPDPARQSDFGFWRTSFGVAFLWNIVP